MNFRNLSAALVTLILFSCALRAPAEDPRSLRAGSVVPDEGYCDQPYIVVTKDGNWLCTLTTGRGREGDKGQHVVATISNNKGKTWSPLVDIEPAGGPEASWVVPLVVPNGRVYAFYTYNGDRVGTLRGKPIRADTLGHYVFKFSDDHGRTWSKDRCRLPLRPTECDRRNDWQGKVQMFWGIDKPKTAGGDVFFAFTKLGRYMLDDGEGWLWRSDNLQTETDPARLHWELLPAGERGIRGPGFGSIQEEHNLVPLSDGSLYCVWRSTLGHPCHAYSRDRGRTWTRPEPMTYTPGGRVVKNPRACPKLWRTAEGRFLFWFHNHGGRSFTDRNPAWIAGGVERGGRIHWSQPEVLLYDPDPKVGMSYPDLVEQDGRYWVTETQKTVARVHQIDRSLLEGLWSQGSRKEVARGGLAMELKGDGLAKRDAMLPVVLEPSKAGGLTVDVWVRFEKVQSGMTIIDTQDARGRRMLLSIDKDSSALLHLADAQGVATWSTDRGLFQAGKLHHIVAVVDDGPRIVTFVVDGLICDGGAERQGWRRYERPIGDLGSGPVMIGRSPQMEVRSLRIYTRPLRTSEAVANYHAGP